jgi:hypothetical protein
MLVDFYPAVRVDYLNRYFKYYRSAAVPMESCDSSLLYDDKAFWEENRESLAIYTKENLTRCCIYTDS